MIISHKHKFILIHTRKTAGSSLKVLLAPHLGNKDLVIGCANDIISSGGTLTSATSAPLKTIKSRMALALAAAKGVPEPIRINRVLASSYEGVLGENPAHPPYDVAKRFVGKVWELYEKICFVRNPFERTVSDYFWRKRITGKDFSFDAYLDRLSTANDSDGILHKTGISNWCMISHNGALAMDTIGRFEDFSSEVDRVFGRFGVAPSAQRPTAKQTNVAKPYADLYTKDRRSRVAELFEDEIAALDYGFPY